MTARSPDPGRRGPAPLARRSAPRWLLLVHHLPAQPSNLRVRTWRRLQQLGAVPIKQSVYALPDTPAAREDFEWLKAEVIAAGGDATVFTAGHVDAMSDDALVDEFRRLRQQGYAALAREVEAALKRESSPRRHADAPAPAVQRLAETFRARLAALDRIDFFGAAGRDRVLTLLTRLEDRARGRAPASEQGRPTGSMDRGAYLDRLWVTRPRPGVDRMASAWLIRRFIDPRARFAFTADRHALPADDAIPFDMFGVEFSHHGGHCTFETLCGRFGIDDPAVARIAAIVHDLDLKDGRFAAADAPTVGAVIEGLQLAIADDGALLERGLELFEALYRAFEQSARASGPRPVAKHRQVRTPAAARNKASERRRGRSR